MFNVFSYFLDTTDYSFQMGAAIVGIVWYIFAAVGIYTLAKNRNMDNAWIAWIPFLQNYLIGELIGDKVWGYGYASLFLPTGQLVFTIYDYFNPYFTGFLGVAIDILSFVFYVYYMTAMYKLYKTYSTKATVMLITSIFLPFLSPIYLFCIRNHQPMELQA